MSTSLHRLSAPELAFVRAWAEGLNLADAWRRYLADEEGSDARLARPALRRLLDRVRAGARAQGRSDIAALLGRDPEAMVDRAADVPSLDEFRARQPEDFYSEAELAELYAAEYGQVDARSAARRRQRLRERMVLALAEVETWGRQRSVQASDPLDRWLEPRVAQRLGAVGLQRFDQLLERMRTMGPRWYRDIPRLGPRGAERLLGWLREHQASLGPVPSDSSPVLLSRTPRAAPTAGAWLAAGSALGSAADSSPWPCLPWEALQALAIEVRKEVRKTDHGLPVPWMQDLSALGAWLSQRPRGSHTWRAYRREVERLWLWVHRQGRGSVLGLGVADAADYLAFLARPGPGWCAPRSTPRWSEAWRPLEGPLSQRSLRTAREVLQSLYGDWLKQGLVSINPWRGLEEATGLAGRAGSGMAGPSDEKSALRALPPAAWSALQAWLTRQAPSEARARLALILELAHGLGLRSGELTSLRWGDVQAANGAGDLPPSLARALEAAEADGLNSNDPASEGRPLWTLTVRGRGGQSRRLALPAAAAALLSHYLHQRDLPQAWGLVPAQAPLIGQLGRLQPLSGMRLYEIVKHAMLHCAREARAAGEDGVALALASGSTHWLRHSHGLRETLRGVTSASLQSHMGHLSPASTRVYREAARRSDH